MAETWQVSLSGNIHKHVSLFRFNDRINGLMKDNCHINFLKNKLA